MLRSRLEIGPPQPGDATELAANLRDQDRAECEAVGITDFQAAIELSIQHSALVWAARVDGELACIFGVAARGTILTPTGVVWMLGTPAVPKHRRILARQAPLYISQMLEAFPYLMNQVHAKNTVATSWLRKMGFVLQPPHPVPPHGELFHLFEKRRV
jgi:hypothetical protein